MSKKWYWENKWYALEYKRLKRLENLEAERQKDKEMHVKHREKRNAYCRDYYYAHRDKRIAQAREYYLKNRNKILIKQMEKRDAKNKLGEKVQGNTVS